MTISSTVREMRPKLQATEVILAKLLIRVPLNLKLQIRVLRLRVA